MVKIKLLITHISDQESGTHILLLPRYRWKVVQKTLRWTAKQRSLIFYNLCFVGHPRKEKAQESFSSIPGYQRTSTEKHNFVRSFRHSFSFTPLPFGDPVMGNLAQKSVRMTGFLRRPNAG